MLSSFYRKKNRRISSFFFILFFVLIIFRFLPGIFNIHYNAISKFKYKKIKCIKLIPSEPNWKVNLTDSPVIVMEQNNIDTIANLLRNVSSYYPSHPTRIWETQMILFWDSSDSIITLINQTDDEGTSININGSVYENSKLGAFLEVLTNYKTPNYSKNATIKNPN